jgi:hypothetical protein
MGLLDIKSVQQLQYIRMYSQDFSPRRSQNASLIRNLKQSESDANNDILCLCLVYFTLLGKFFRRY